LPASVSSATLQTEPGAADERGAPARPSAWRRHAPLLGTCALLLFPLVVLALRVGLGHQLAPDGDTSLIELHTRDVFTTHPPLLGSYDRFGFNLPGPMLFALLAPVYRLLGSRYGALQVGVLLVNAIAIVAVVTVAWRRGRGALLLWTAALLALLVHGVGAHDLASPWEPNAVVLPTVALVALAWDAAEGAWWSFVPAVIAASFVAQVSLSALLPAIGVVVAALVLAVLARPRTNRRAAVTPLVVAAVVGIVLWIPPVVDQLANATGNFGRVANFAQHGSHPIGWSDGYRIVALQWNWWAPWLGRAVPLKTLTSEIDLHAAPIVPWALVAALVATVVAARRRLGDCVRLGVVVLVASACAVVGFSHLTGPVYSWITDPARPLGMLCWWVAGWCAWRVWSAWAETHTERVIRNRVRTIAAGALAAITVVAVGAAAIDAVRLETTTPVLAGTIDRLAARAATELHAAGAHDPTLVRSNAAGQLVFGSGVTIGREELVLALEHHGVPTVVDDNLDSLVRFGAQRAKPARATRELLLTEATTATPPGWRRVAVADPLTPEQRHLRVELAQRLAAQPHLTFTQLRDLARRDHELAALLERLSTVPDLPVLALLLGPPR
jgi:hypothetical protein